MAHTLIVAGFLFSDVLTRWCQHLINAVKLEPSIICMAIMTELEKMYTFPIKVILLQTSTPQSRMSLLKFAGIRSEMLDWRNVNSALVTLSVLVMH